MQSHCMHGFDLKMRGTRADGSTLMRKNGAPVYSAFFQQSSFATHAIANERFAVKVRNDAPLELLGPVRLQRPDRRRRGAQLDAAAGRRFVRRVRRRRRRAIGPDGGEDRGLRSDHRGRHARRIGSRSRASSAPPTRSIIPAAPTWSRKSASITGDGVRFSLETSAQPAVFREAVEALMPAGTCVLLGSARAGTEVSFEMPFLQFGRIVRGVIQGESHPQEFIPRLVDFLMAGPDAGRADDDVLPARRDQPRGAGFRRRASTIKPVLRMPH